MNSVILSVHPQKSDSDVLMSTDVRFCAVRVTFCEYKLTLQQISNVNFSKYASLRYEYT